jgi:hypothetical protein
VAIPLFHFKFSHRFTAWLYYCGKCYDSKVLGGDSLITISAPKLLQGSEIDQTKVILATHIVLLPAVDTSAICKQFLTRVSLLARLSDT